jgi:8-amino-7-oxononanoate synthase
VPMREDLAGRLAALEAEGLSRSTWVVQAPIGPELQVPGRADRLVNLASNDYLGLAGHPALAQTAAAAARELGAGVGAARLVTGTLRLHVELERELAVLLGVERALLFGSGYLAHVGTIPALVDQARDVIYSDERNHASIVDGCRLARARTRVFRHGDIGQLDRLLAEDAGRPGRRLVVTETVFSMDGDTAPLEGICAVAERFGAWVLVDEAHAFGLRGPAGAGLVAELGLGAGVQVRMGTLGKAAGSYGAFVGGCAELVDFLVGRARSFVYSTALPPSVVAAALAGVRLIRAAGGEERRRRLRHNSAVLARGLAAQGWELSSGGPILPLHVGDPRQAVALAEHLFVAGVLARAMRYPTVPRGTERLRLVASAGLTAEQVERALAAFEQVKALEPFGNRRNREHRSVP